MKLGFPNSDNVMYIVIHNILLAYIEMHVDNNFHLCAVLRMFGNQTGYFADKQQPSQSQGK